MKRKIFILFTTIILSTLSIPVYAEESIDTEESVELTEDQQLELIRRDNLIGQTSAASEYWTDSDEGLLYEDDSILSNEYKETLEAQPQESLTMEQIKQEWILQNGYAYPPNDLAGDAGDFIRGEGSVNPTYCGYVTFKANCPTGLSQTVYIKIMDTGTMSYYAYELSSADGYISTVKVPVGTFVILEGGPIDDIENRYAVSQSYFSVEKGEYLALSVLIADREEQFNKYHGLGEGSEEITEEEVITEEEKQKKERNIVAIIMLILICSSVVLPVFVYIKKRKKSR